MDVDARRVRAFRLAGQGLAAPPAPDGPPEAALRGWAVQDSPPGAATAAALARTAAPIPVGWLDAALYDDRSLVALYNARTATAVVPADEVAAFGTAFAPTDEAGLRAIVASALPDVDDGYAEPVALGVEAIADALDGAVISRDDLHEALRRRLPERLLPWCEGCQSHHVRRGMLVMASLRGRLCLAGRAGRQPAFARTDQWVGWDPPRREEAGAALVRRYLRGYGPSTPAHFAQWAGLAPAHARELWALVAGELADVAVEAAPAWILRDDRDRLAAPPAAPGVRLLAAGDPLLLGRDRETLVPDPALRKRAWSAIGGPGVVLADGEVVALWRARRRGKTLAVSVNAFDAVDRDAVAAAAERLAPHRGATSASVEWASA